MRTTSVEKPKTIHSPEAPRRNSGIPLDLGWLKQVQVNKSAAERRTATLAARRTVKKQWQAAWLLKAVSCIDLTTLAGDDTPGKIRRLCAKARHPIRADLLEAMGVADLGITAGAVCVYPTMVSHAARALEGSGIPIASVAAAFPAGLSPMKSRVEEIHYAIREGAAEIDIVITRQHVLTGHWQALHDEVAAFRSACGEARLKTAVPVWGLQLIDRHRAPTGVPCHRTLLSPTPPPSSMKSVSARRRNGVSAIRRIRRASER